MSPLIQITLAVGIPIFGGLGFLAYREPTLYEYLYWPILIVLALVGGGCLIWNSAVSISVYTLLSGVPSLKFTQVDAVRDVLQVPYNWLIMVWMVTAVYMTFLRMLADFIRGKTANDSGPDGSNDKTP